MKLRSTLRKLPSFISYVLPSLKDPIMVAIPVVRGAMIAFPSWRTASMLFTYAWAISMTLLAVFFRNMTM